MWWWVDRVLSNLYSSSSYSTSLNDATLQLLSIFFFFFFSRIFHFRWHVRAFAKKYRLLVFYYHHYANVLYACMYLVNLKSSRKKIVKVESKNAKKSLEHNFFPLLNFFYHFKADVVIFLFVFFQPWVTGFWPIHDRFRTVIFRVL